jgi:hypothetical protein
VTGAKAVMGWTHNAFGETRNNLKMLVEKTYQKTFIGY